MASISREHCYVKGLGCPICARLNERIDNLRQFIFATDLRDDITVRAAAVVIKEVNRLRRLLAMEGVGRGL